MNVFKIIGNGIASGISRFAFYGVWNLAGRIAYAPKVRYLTAEVKKKMNKPCIYIANHTNHRDGSFLPQLFAGKKMTVLVMSKWFDKKGLNIFFTHLPYIRIDLNDMDTQWMEDVKAVLKKGRSVLIFPEGKLEREDHLEPFQPGFLMVARQTDVPIIPIAVKGKYKKFHRSEIIVSDEIDFDVHKKGRPSQILKEGAALYQQRIQEMLDM